jgi:hypothetical protein
VLFLSNKSISSVIKSSYFSKSLSFTACLYVRGLNGLVGLDCAINAKSSGSSLLNCVNSACSRG